jgi:hypothetical protein
MGTHTDIELKVAVLPAICSAPAGLAEEFRERQTS